MDIKTINSIVLLSLFSCNIYSMEEGAGGIKQKEGIQEESAYIKQLKGSISNLIQGQVAILGAYGVAYNFLTNNAPSLLNNISAYEWIVDALYNKFVASKPEQEAIYNAIKLIVDGYPVSKAVAFEKFFNWMGFKSIDAFREFLRKEITTNKHDKNKMDLLLRLHDYIKKNQEVINIARDKQSSTESVLHKFARYNNAEFISQLLNAVAKKGNISEVINKRNEKGRTPLHITARHSQGGEATSVLLDFKADPNVADNNGRTPLHIAAEEGNIAQARLLIKNGADINAIDEGGNTPLHLATKMGEKEMINFLLKNGANPEIANKEGVTVDQLTMDEKAFYGDIKSIVTAKDKVEKKQALEAFLQRLELVPEGQGASSLTDMTRVFLADTTQRYLLEAIEENNINEVLLLRDFLEYLNNEEILNLTFNNILDKEEGTLLHVVAVYSNSDMINVLIGEGLNREAENEEGYTALHIAAQVGNGDALTALLAAEADVNASGDDGNTPLHLAAENGHKGMVELLLTRGADSSIKNGKGEVAIEVAKNDEVKKIIEEFNQKTKKQKKELQESDIGKKKPGKEEE